MEAYLLTRRVIKPTDRWIGFKRHHAVFSGAQVVESLKSLCLVKTEAAAIQLAEKFQNERLIESIDEESLVDLNDEKQLFRHTPSSLDFGIRLEDETYSPLQPGAWDRAVASVLGAFVADTASSGLDGRILSSQTRDIAIAEYKDLAYAESGDLSSYGFDAGVLLESLVSRGGLHGNFLAKDSYYAYETYRGVPLSTVKHFCQRMESGYLHPEAAVPDSKNDFLAKLPLVVARFGGTGQLAKKTIEAVSVHQNNPDVLQTALLAASFLERIVLGSSIKDTIKWSVESETFTSKQRSMLLKAVKAGQMSTVGAVKKFGMGSQLSGFQAVIQQLVICKDFPKAIRLNIKAGGKCCARAMYLGACIAAQDGINAIPLEWKEKTKKYGTLRSIIRAMLSLRGIRSTESTDIVVMRRKSSAWLLESAVVSPIRAPLLPDASKRSVSDTSSAQTVSTDGSTS